MMQPPRHRRRCAAARFAAGLTGPAPVYKPECFGRTSARRRARRRIRVVVRLAVVAAVALTAHTAHARWAGAPARFSAPPATAAAVSADGPAPAVARHPREARPARSARRAVLPADRIAAFVQAVRPRRGPRYASFLSRVIRKEARRNSLSPLVLTATAYIESEFSKESGPCIGVMQVYPPNIHRLDRGDGLDPDLTRDNVALGARELASYYHARGKTPSLRRMWGRYNGCGPSGEYVERALRVLHRLRAGDAQSWRAHLTARGPLWLE